MPQDSNNPSYFSSMNERIVCPVVCGGFLGAEITNPYEMDEYDVAAMFED